MVKEETEESKAGEAKELEKMDKELIMLQQELDGIDQGKIDGKWVSANGEICKGQAILSAVLDECYCLVSEIQFH